MKYICIKNLSSSRNETIYRLDKKTTIDCIVAEKDEICKIESKIDKENNKIVNIFLKNDGSIFSLNNENMKNFITLREYNLKKLVDK